MVPEAAGEDGEARQSPYTVPSPSNCTSGCPLSLRLLPSATNATLRAMTRIITQRELRNDSAAILREVQAGRTVIIARNGVPVAELRPVPPRRFVPRAVIADAAKRAPRVDASRLRADLDAVVDQSVHG